MYLVLQIIVEYERRNKMKKINKPILCGYTIVDANGGGDLLISIGNSKPFWEDAFTCSKLFGENYYNTKEIGEMIEEDYNTAMQQCVGLYYP